MYARASILAFAATCIAAYPREARCDPAAARALFDDGRKLMASGKYQAACPKFEESYKLDPGIGTLFNLADCWEHIGKTASAWVRFQEVADAAARAGQADRQKIARTRAAALEPKLAKLVVQVKAGAGVEVTKDGAAFGAAQWDTAIPIDPGSHTIEARAPSKLPWSQTIEIPSNGATTTVVVPALEAAPLDAKAASAFTTGTPGAAAPPDVATSTQSASSWNGRKTAAVALGGIGVAAGVFSMIKLLDFNDKKDQANTVCPDACQEPKHSQAESFLSDARSSRTQSIVAGLVGGASLAAGAVLWFGAGNSAAQAARVQVHPLWGSGVEGFMVHGAW